MSRRKPRIPTEADAGPLADENPFAALDATALPPSSASSPVETKAPSAPPTPRKPGLRVEIRREKYGRGGKTVTTLTGLTTLDKRSFDRLLKDLKARLGTGGATIPGGIQLQGDCRDRAEEVLRAEGFRPVRAGG